MFFLIYFFLTNGSNFLRIFVTVCVDVLTGFKENHPDALSDIQKSIAAFKKYCPSLKGKQRDVVSNATGREGSSPEIYDGTELDLPPINKFRLA